MKSALAGTQDFAGGVEDYKFEQAICCVQFADEASNDEHNVGRRDGDFQLFPQLAELSAYADCDTDWL